MHRERLYNIYFDFFQHLKDATIVFVKNIVFMPLQINILMPILTSSASAEESDTNEKEGISSNSKKQTKKEYKSAHEPGLYL